MFIGHVGVGIGAKFLVPRVSLGTTLLASMLLDLLWPAFLLTGLEQVKILPGSTRIPPLSFTEYPFSHSLLAVFGWAAAFAIAHYLVRRNRKEAWICGALVLSHWLLDLLVHRPDLQIVPGFAKRVGLGIWNNLTMTLVIELTIFAVGIVLYCYTTKPADKTGSIGFSGMLVVLLVLYFANIFGPPPPNPEVIAWTGMASWLFIIWGYWIERHRTLRWLYN